MIDGDDVANCSAERLRNIRRNKVSMVFQHFALFPHKTVAENVAFGLKVKGFGGGRAMRPPPLTAAKPRTPEFAQGSLMALGELAATRRYKDAF